MKAALLTQIQCYRHIIIIDCAETIRITNIHIIIESYIYLMCSQFLAYLCECIVYNTQPHNFTKLSILNQKERRTKKGRRQKRTYPPPIFSAQHAITDEFDEIARFYHFQS